MSRDRGGTSLPYLDRAMYTFILIILQQQYLMLSRLQLASANCIAALTSRDGILWAQGIPNVKNRQRESIENANLLSAK